MRIAIASINYAPEMTGIAVYTTGMARHLAQCGHQVDVYTGFPYYPSWRKRAEDVWKWFRDEQDGGVTVHRSYLYVPGRPSAIRRMVHELSFVLSASVNYLFSPRAECTIVVGPPLFLGIPMILCAWLKGSRTVFHVQDLQPDAAVELGMLKRGPLTSFFYLVERITYRLCDRVSTISEGMRRRILAKGVPEHKTFLFRNWANDELIRVQSPDTAFRREWSIGERKVVLYSGNMGVKQGLPSVLDCAARLAHREDIVFVLVGDGGEKQELVREATARGLDNVRFVPLQPYERLSELLATADVSVIPQRRGVSDIVLPSKLSNILGSARPVIAAALPRTELAGIVRDAQCGTVIEPGDDVAMAEAVLALCDDPALRQRMGEAGRRYMERRLTRRVVLEDLSNTLVDLAYGGEALGAEAESEAAMLRG